MKITGEEVKHNGFGVGKITDQTADSITVQFSSDFGSKRFLYPSAFGSFLTLCDQALSEKMKSELCEIRDKAESEQNARHEEMMKLHKEERVKQFKKKRDEAKKLAAIRFPDKIAK